MKALALFLLISPIISIAEPYYNCDQVPLTLCRSGYLFYLDKCVTKWTFAYGNPVAYPDYKPMMNNNQLVKCNN